jgi:hypothetical protein
MRFLCASRTLLIVAALGLCAQGQDTPNREAPTNEVRGMPPRAAPGDYQAHAAAGTVTVAAEFLGHSIPRGDEIPLTTEDYVVIETAMFGASGTRLKISSGDFSLRIYAKKTKPVPSQPFGMVFHSLKDPVWEDKVAVEEKEKSSGTGISTSGNAQTEKPAPPRMPLEMQRAMQQRVEKVALPEGDRLLPQAGLIFFPYHGKVEKIHSIELIYAGPTGTATLSLQP